MERYAIQIRPNFVDEIHLVIILQTKRLTNLNINNTILYNNHNCYNINLCLI